MKKIFAPWRSTYTKEEALNSSDNDPHTTCVFCNQFKKKTDKKHFILRRFKHCFAMLNLYPYNAGHLLIITNKHIGLLHNLSPQAREEIIHVTSASIEALTSSFGNKGTNVGCNLGKAAGAGIPAHFHMHVLPRWQGDTNFMPTLAETKVISFDLKEVYNKLEPIFREIKLP